jgi:hypothetical protein
MDVQDTQCFDGIDNDADLLIDFPNDPGCSSTLDDDETDPVLPQCSDGVDNDTDGDIDFPSDVGCDSATDDDETDPAPPPSSGGGGSSRANKVILTGYAYPDGEVVVFQDGVRVGTTQADADATFTYTLRDAPLGTHVYSFAATDANNLRSNTQSVSIDTSRPTRVTVSNIFISPSTLLDKVSVRQGDTITVTGQTVPRSLLTLQVFSELQLEATTTADADGWYTYTFPTETLAYGEHVVKVHAEAPGGETSGFGRGIRFTVGDTSIQAPPPGSTEATQLCPQRGDLNDDCRVNLIDFSIAAFWWERPLTGPFVAAESTYLSGDGIVTLVDFSIIAYYWTG